MVEYMGILTIQGDIDRVKDSNYEWVEVTFSKTSEIEKGKYVLILKQAEDLFFLCFINN